MQTIRAGVDAIRLFNTLCVEINALCNRECYFCPNKHKDRPDELMPWDMIEKIAEEMARIKYRGSIHPYVYNEPMRDKRLLDFFRLWKKTNPRVMQVMNTNGDYIKHRDDIEALFDAGLDSLIINIYAAKDHTPRGIALAESRYQRMLELAKPTDKAIAYWKKGVIQVNRKFGDHFEGGFKKSNRSGNIEWFRPALAEPIPKMCVRPWRVLNFNWKGESLLCCNDYHGKETFGNIRDRTVVEIWNDMELNRIRSRLQEKDRSVTDLCAACDWHGGPYQHMIQRVEMPATSHQ